MTAVVVEVGRPGVSTFFHDVQEICTALAKAGVEFDPGSGVTALMVDPAAGRFREDILNERVLNGIVHFSSPNERLLDSLRALKGVSSRINTVFSIGLSNRLKDDGIISTVSIAEEAGFKARPHAKTNVGLGRS
jgi:hypothetical protein